MFSIVKGRHTQIKTLKLVTLFRLAYPSHSLLLPLDDGNIHVVSSSLSLTQLMFFVQKRFESAHNVNKVIKEDYEIVTNLELTQRSFETTPTSASVTGKDHKEDYRNYTKCRLTNPYKRDIDKISKKILEPALFVMKQKTQLKKWTNTLEALTWFKQLKNKNRKSFITFDFCSF